MAALGGGGTEEIELPHDESATVAAVLDALVARRPRLAERLRTPQWELQRFVNVFIGADNIKHLGGLGARVPPGAEVWVIPPGSGG
jgi:molybdopterin converting factor small subunit